MLRLRLVFFLLLFTLGARVSLAQQVQITGFTNLDLGTWTGNGDLAQENPLCVYSLTGNNYQIRATGNGPPGNSFTMTGAGGTIPLEIEFKDTGAYLPLTSGTFTDFTGANSVAEDCGGLYNASLKVRATETALGSVLAGSYFGTITVLLGPR